MVERREVAVSREIQRQTGRTFHLATRVLPEWARDPTYVLYAFFRTADEVVDDPDPGPPAEQRAVLERIRAAAVGERETDDPVLSTFHALKERHGIADREVHAFVDAMAMDVERAGYETFADLESYLRGSSVAVAYMMLAVMDPDRTDVARPHARALGEAFQLTNFLRDVREDVVDYDRVYLPRETLRAHGATERQVRNLEFDASVAAAVRAEVTRTEARYREGVAGIRYLPDGCQFAVLLAATLYAEHHRQVRAHGFDVLSERRALTRRRRLEVLVRTWYHWRRTGDPEATFYAVSPIEAEPDEAVEAADTTVSVDGSPPNDYRIVTRPARSLAGTVRTLLGSP